MLRNYARWLGVVLLPLLAGAQGALAPPRASQAAQQNLQSGAQAGAHATGSAACKTCHEENFASVQKQAHRIATAPGPGGLQGCEGCHGPGSAHVANPGDKSTIFSFKAASGKDASARCLTCHVTSHEQAGFNSSIHSRNQVSCLDCHSEHHSATPRLLLVKTQPQLCYTCHGDKRANFNMPSHHKVNEGLVQCSDCHNPHGSPLPSNLRTAAAADAVCYTCHADKRGPFVYEHEPVKVDGCMACHNPHGTANPHLLKVSNVNILCLQCHTTSSFSGAPGVPSFHNMTTQYQSCLSCHTQVHGSNFNAFFFQ